MDSIDYCEGRCHEKKFCDFAEECNVEKIEVTLNEDLPNRVFCMGFNEKNEYCFRDDKPIRTMPVEVINGNEYVKASDYLEYQEKCRNRIDSLITENKKTYNQMMETEKEYQKLLAEKESKIDNLTFVNVEYEKHIKDLESDINSYKKYEQHAEEQIKYMNEYCKKLESEQKEPTNTYDEQSHFIYENQLRTTIMIMAEELAKTRM